MNNEPRTWKYMVPGTFGVMLFVLTGLLYGQAPIYEPAQYLMWITGGLAVMCGVAAIINALKVITDHYMTLYERRLAAQSMTPLVMLSQNLKQMHPEAVRTLNMFGVRTTWQENIKNFGEIDFILLGTNVHMGFVEMVLDRSGTALMPKRRLADGSKKWDPDGLVTDREQYDQLEKWMFARMIVTRSNGEFQPAEFIPPWTPVKIKEIMGLVGDQDLYKPIEAEWKDLNGNTQKTQSRPQPQAVENDKELTPEEIAAITIEQEQYAKKYDA
jgi:hypothetical protein